MKRTSGFSLIELMVVLALVGLFATMALPLAELAVKRNQEIELRTALRQIREGLDAYKQAADDGRVTVRPGDAGYPRTLAVLVDGVVDNKSPERRMIYFLRRLPRDPFARPGVRAEDSWGKRSYKSSYDRPQPGDDVYDVYSLSTDTGINGIPYHDW
ncbi:MAG TPA: type II secretion system protein [Azonexus sp.]|nr:type II secretion system protein [Azonexus sp.]